MRPQNIVFGLVTSAALSLPVASTAQTINTTFIANSLNGCVNATACSRLVAALGTRLSQAVRSGAITPAQYASFQATVVETVEEKATENDFSNEETADLLSDVNEQIEDEVENGSVPEAVVEDVSDDIEEEVAEIEAADPDEEYNGSPT